MIKDYHVYSRSNGSSAITGIRYLSSRKKGSFPVKAVVDEGFYKIVSFQWF